MKRLFILLIVILHLPFRLAAAENESTLEVQDIVRHLDDLYRSESSYAEMEMVIVTPHWQRTL
ncbi:outer membrane lipoprotein-sorting protein, partial [candidate division KSB1 bacterium]|nr:outer membrane lipoprotein-sorting protein [candidate division KSB1 bacterium]